MLSPNERFQLGIQDFEIHNEFKTDHRQNVLVQEPQLKHWDEIAYLEAKIVTSGLPNASVIDGFDLVIRPHCASEQIVQIQCVQDKIPIFQLTTGIVALEAALVLSEDPLVLIVDHDTTIYSHGSSMVKDITMLDLCAGGFGGWSTAMQKLADDFAVPMKKIIGIDYDHSAMQYWALNHSASYIETQQIPWQALHRMTGNIAIVGDLQSNHWRQAVFHQQPQLVTISSPCISWSGAGKEQGFHADSGIVMLTALGLVRFSRPRVVLFEQAKHFAEHPHFQKFMRLVVWAGYRMVYHKCLDAKDHVPMARPRWIGIAMDVLSHDNFDMAKFIPKWLGQQMFHPRAFGCDWKLPEDVKQTVQVPHNVLAKYFDKKYAPSCMKGSLSKKRSAGWDEPMTVLMANYGSQHKLAQSQLENKGLYGHFLRESCVENPAASQLRWWHPLELVLMFVPHRKVFLHPDNVEAWRHLGNAITVTHGIFALASIIPIMFAEGQYLTPDQILREVIASRMTAENSRYHSHSKGWIVSKHEYFDQACSDAQSFFDAIPKVVGSMKAGHVFIPGYGITRLESLKSQWLQDTFQHPKIAVSPTLADHNWGKLQIQIGNRTFVGANILMQTDLKHLVPLWMGYADCKNADERSGHLHPQVLHIGEANESDQQNMLKTCVVFNHDQAWIISTPDGLSIRTVIQDAGISMPWFDAVGRINIDTPIQHTQVLFQEQSNTRAVTGDLIAVCIACTQMRITAKYDFEDDTVTLILSSLSDFNVQSVAAMIDFWQQCINRDWFGEVGRKIIFEAQELSFNIRLTPNFQTLPLPIHETIIVATMHCLRNLLSAIEARNSCQGQLIVIKWHSTILWSGYLPEFLNMTFFRGIISFFVAPWTLYQDVNFVCMGRQVGDEVTLQHLFQQHQRYSNRSYITLIVQTMGVGGGPNDNGAKKQWDVHIRNQLAAALLPCGVNVAVLPQMTETILKHFGRSRIQQTLKMTSEDQQQSELLKLAQQAGFQIQQPSKKTPKPNGGGKRLKADQIQAELRNIDLEGITLEPGFLENQRGEKLKQIAQIYPKTTGVVLSKADQIQTWLHSTGVLSPDALAAFVVGSPDITTNYPHEQLCLPARDSYNRPMLLSGVLIQFGQDQVVFAPKKDHKPVSEEHQLVAVTTWKDETSEEHWNDVLNNPIRAFTQYFTDGKHKEIFLATWGVSYQAGFKQAKRHDAESVQFHATVAKENLQTLLRHSGLRGTYITPKCQEGGTPQDWRVIWLPLSIKRPEAHSEATKQMAKLDETCGLVRSKDNYGIRVKKDDYAASFRIVKPDQPVPDAIQGKTVFKITPFPLGMTVGALKDWMHDIKWQGFPIKPVGPQAWLFASDCEPPSAFVTYNGTPMLVRSLPKKGIKHSSPVIAGPRLPQLTDPKSQGATESGLLKVDPWAQYKSAQGNQSTNSAPMLPTGTIQQKMQLQDDKIANITDELNKLKNSQQQLGEEMHQRVDQLQTSLDTSKTSFTQQLGQVKTDLESSFQSALQAQQQSIANGFQDLKNMFLQTQESKGVRRSHHEMDANADASM